jgi:hypothetical protein
VGWIKDVKAETIGKAAAKAREDGKSVFAALLNSPATHSTMSGEIGDWSLMVAAVEAEGWVLSHWTTSVDTKGRPQAYPLFRRVEAPRGTGSVIPHGL